MDAKKIVTLLVVARRSKLHGCFEDELARWEKELQPETPSKYFSKGMSPGRRNLWKEDPR